MTAPENKLIETEPPFSVMIGAWWGFTWRGMVWMIAFMLAVMILMIPLGFLWVAMGHLPPNPQDPAMQMLANIISIVLAFLVSYRALRKIIGKKFGGYRLVFLTPQAVNAAEEAIAKATDSALLTPAPPPPPSSGVL